MEVTVVTPPLTSATLPGTECLTEPTLSESMEPPLPPSLRLLASMLELEGMSPTLPEWSTLQRGLLNQLLNPRLTPTTEATIMVWDLWDTVGSMVVMPAPTAMVWATVGTVVSTELRP